MKQIVRFPHVQHNFDFQTFSIIRCDFQIFRHKRRDSSNTRLWFKGEKHTHCLVIRNWRPIHFFEAEQHLYQLRKVLIYRWMKWYANKEFFESPTHYVSSLVISMEFWSHACHVEANERNREKWRIVGYNENKQLHGFSIYFTNK